MAKKKSDVYYLDPASLSVKKVRVSLRQRIFRWLRILFVGAFVFLGNDIKHRNDTDDCQ